MLRLLRTSLNLYVQAMEFGAVCFPYVCIKTPPCYCLLRLGREKAGGELLGALLLHVLYFYTCTSELLHYRVRGSGCK